MTRARDLANIADGDITGTLTVDAITASGTIAANSYTGDGSSLTGINTDLVSDTTPQLGGDLDTNGNDINFGDNDKATFGDAVGGDLSIFHDGLNSYIQDDGTGNLFIQASNVLWLRDATGTAYFSGTSAGEAALYYNGGERIATKSGGIDVTGTVTADGVLNNNKSEFFASESALVSTGSTAKVYATDSTFDGVNGSLVLQSRPTSGADVYIATGATPKKVAKFDDGGDISFYDSTGATQGFFWDASTQRLGLGTTSPSNQLHLYGTSPIIRLEDSAAGGQYARINGDGTVGALVLEADSGGGGGSLMNFKVGGTEAMRIDSSGNLLVGRTDAFASTATSGGGSVLNADGLIEATKDGTVAMFNRNTTNGRNVEFRKDGTIVGDVTVNDSGTTYNTTSDIRLKTDIAPIADATDKLMAMNAVTHKWKADPDADAVVGFIAQEMQEIVPEAVSKGDSEDDMWSMDYGRITPVLVAALQDAHRKIEELEQRIADMENK
jgi:hypothetical protein